MSIPRTAYMPPLNVRCRSEVSIVAMARAECTDSILRRFEVFNAPVNRKKTAALVVVPVLAPAAGAQGKIMEIGRATDVAAAAPSCPRTCNAISRTTGYQAKVGPKQTSFLVPPDGPIVALSIQPSKLEPSQIKFFNENLGGEASAGISVLRPGKHLFSRTIATSSIY